MGIYKSVYVIGLIDYFTEDYNAFCNLLSQKLQVNIILKKYLNGELTSKQLLSTNYKNSVVVKYFFEEADEHISNPEVYYHIELNNDKLKEDYITITKPGLISCFVPLIISRWDDFVELITTEHTNVFYKKDALENLNIINELFAIIGCNKLYCVPDIIEEVVTNQLTEESENANIASTLNLFETIRKNEINYFLELTPTLLSS